MEEFSKKYLSKPFEGCAEIKDLDAVLWEFESADIRAHTLEVSLEFWRELQNCKHLLLKPIGDVFYKYLKVNVNQHQETNFLIY